MRDRLRLYWVIMAQERPQQCQCLQVTDTAWMYNLTKVYKRIYTNKHLTIRHSILTVLYIQITVFSSLRLSGFLAPSSGTAKVNGYDIMTDIDKVRQSIGLCPQHDILFENMTVEEHLRYFCKVYLRMLFFTYDNHLDNIRTIEILM